MAREPCVSRKMKTSEGIVILYDLEKHEEVEIEFKLPRWKSEENVMMELTELVKTNYKVLSIKSMTHKEGLYGCSELEYLNIAYELDPVTRRKKEI